MKIRTSGLKFLFSICVVIINASAQVNPEPATGLIPTDRCIDWSHAGIPGGIPAYPVTVNVKSDPYNAKGNGLIL